ncbi:MAG: DUF1846 domain-containing protein [Elusimicrobia bacterium]|nr:DUF1846 domain-containing protein [Candidatus Obscuribacterium magneticum]
MQQLDERTAQTTMTQNHSLGFDNEKYLKEQTGAILERVGAYADKLYLEFGGKLLFDYHAARVLPGFDPNVKMHLLQNLKGQADIILCIYAGDIERKKVRADFGHTYDVDALKLIDDLRKWGIEITAVVITRFEGQHSARVFKNKLERSNIPVYLHYPIKGYPTDIDRIVSDEGYGKNDHIKTTKPLVIVTGPGPGSGKLSTCLSQLYHDHRQGLKSGYSKFETFPIWNIPLKHPVNVAYEAATADLEDFNLIDPFHLEAYGQMAINYNRDVEIFPILKRMLEKITGAKSPYQSPTDMGVNRAGFGIVNDEVVQEAARQEIIRRFFRISCEYVMGFVEKKSVQRLELLMEELELKPDHRRVVGPARAAAEEARVKGKGNNGIFCGAAIELKDGSLITGTNSPLMHAASSVIMNAVKKMAMLPDNLHLLAPSVISSLAELKKNILHGDNISLDMEETLVALSISSTHNPAAGMAMEKLKDLRGCEVHMTHIPTPGDEAGLRRLGVNLTSEPNFSSKNLFEER